MESAQRPQILDAYMSVRSRLAAVIYNRVKCAATTSDLLQDTFLRFWERRALLRDVADLAGYFVITGRNLAIDYERRRRIAPFVDGIEGLETISDPSPTPEDVAIGRQQLLRLQDAIEQMPGRPRQVFVMARIEGLSYVEIGARLGISPKTVFSHMVVALERLKQDISLD